LTSKTIIRLSKWPKVAAAAFKFFEILVSLTY
jgi:hypothetical protein